MTLAALVGLPIKIGPEKVERQRVVPKYSVGGKSWRGFEQDGVKMSQRTSRGGVKWQVERSVLFAFAAQRLIGTVWRTVNRAGYRVEALEVKRQRRRWRWRGGGGRGGREGTIAREFG